MPAKRRYCVCFGGYGLSCSPQWSSTSCGTWRIRLGGLPEACKRSMHELCCNASARNLADNLASIVNFRQRFENRAAIDRDRAGLVVGVGKSSAQAFQIAVEYETDKLPVAVNHRRSGVSADDVERGNEVERCAQIEIALSFAPTRRQIEWRLCSKRGAAPQ